MFDNVVIGVDGLPGGRDAIRLAEQLAAPDGRLTLAHIYTPAPTVRGGVGLISWARDESRALLAREREACPRAETLSVFAGSVGQGLHAAAEQERADLLVVGSCHHGTVGRVLTADHTRQALSGAPCALAVAPRGYTSAGMPLHSLGVAYDESSEGEHALGAARRMAEALGGDVDVLRVVTFADAQHHAELMTDLQDAREAAVEDARRRLQSLEGVGSSTVVFGDPEQQLAKLAERCDLLVVGSRGYGPVGRLLHGSVSDHLARHVPCPLLVLPRATDISPMVEFNRFSGVGTPTG